MTARAPLDKIHTTATGRRAATREQDKALERDIKERGVLEPLILKPRSDGSYDVISGNRRVKIARKLGLTDLPFIERDADDTYTAGTLMNLLHAPMRDIDVADYVIQQFVAGGGASADDAVTVLKNISKSPDTDPDAVRVISRVCKDLGLGAWDDYVPKLIKLVRLPEDLLTPLRDGAITSDQANALKSVKEQEVRADLTNRASEETLSAKDIKQVIRDENLNPPKDTPDKPEAAVKAASGIEDAENIVSERLSTLSPKAQSRVKRLMNDIAEVFRQEHAKHAGSRE